MANRFCAVLMMRMFSGLCVATANAMAATAAIYSARVKQSEEVKVDRKIHQQRMEEQCLINEVRSAKS